MHFFSLTAVSLRFCVVSIQSDINFRSNFQNTSLQSTNVLFEISKVTSISLSSIITTIQIQIDDFSDSETIQLTSITDNSESNDLSTIILILSSDIDDEFQQTDILIQSS